MGIQIFRKNRDDRSNVTKIEKRGKNYWYELLSVGEGVAKVAEEGAVPAAQACKKLLTGSMIQVPIIVGKADQQEVVDDFWTPVPEHRANGILKYPSKWMDRNQFWEWMYGDYFGSYNSYAIIRRSSKDYRPSELIPAQCHGVEHTKTTRGVKVSYWLRPITAKALNAGSNAKKDEFTELVPSGNVLAFHGPGFDGKKSPSPIEGAGIQVLKSMGLSYDRINKYLENLNLLNYLHIDPEVVAGKNPDQVKKIIEDLNERIVEHTEKGETLLLPPGTDFKIIPGLSPVELGLIETLNFGVSEIARIYEVPPREIFHYMSGQAPSRTSIEGDSTYFYRRSIQPHIIRFQSQLETKLLLEADKSEGVVIRLPTDNLRYGSFSERMKVVETGVSRAGVLTRNEGRKILKKKPIKGEENDRLLDPKGASPSERDEPDKEADN